MSFTDHIDAITRNAKADLERAGPSFSEAYKGGHHRELAFKTAGVTAGVLITAKGVEQLVKGASERVPGTQDPSATQANYTRMFVGALTTFFGASALYLSACKSIAAAR